MKRIQREALAVVARRANDEKRAAHQQRQADLAVTVEDAAARVYGAGERIPPTQGGRFFRDLATLTGYEEQAISTVARTLGLWPWTPGQVCEAFRNVANGFPELEGVEQRTRGVRVLEPVAVVRERGMQLLVGALLAE